MVKTMGPLDSPWLVSEMETAAACASAGEGDPATRRERVTPNVVHEILDPSFKAFSLRR
jgi:hypothetical protein